MKAPQINDLTFATIAGGAFIALALGLPAGAQAAPSGIGSAQDTVNELEDNGFKVVLNKMGASPTRSLHGRLGSSRRDGHPSRSERRRAGEPNRLSNRVFDGQVLTTGEPLGGCLLSDSEEPVPRSDAAVDVLS